MTLPNFMMIGVAKAGTTSFFRLTAGSFRTTIDMASSLQCQPFQLPSYKKLAFPAKPTTYVTESKESIDENSQSFLCSYWNRLHSSGLWESRCRANQFTIH